MVTLFSSTSDGVRRRCDSHCYNAKKPKCRCICSGRNHGVGLAQAQENTSRISEALLERARAEDRTVIITRDREPTLA